MNNKGFTLVELLATIIVLSLVAGITFSIVRGNFGKAKEHMEEVFVDTIRDALDVYLNSGARNLNFNSSSCNISKKHGLVSVETAIITMDKVYKDDLVNPANKDVECANAVDIEISIYKDEDYVYYYSVDKDEFGCLKNIGGDYETVISNLPEGYTCS